MADRYTFGPFQLNCLTRELWRGDQHVPLTPKAFELLTVLVASGGGAMAKDALLKRVWPDSFVAEDTLTQNIATLRKALGDSPDHPQYIVTVPRFGYRFAAPVSSVAPAARTGATQEARVRESSARGIVVLAISGTALVIAAIVVALAWVRPGRDDGDFSVRFEVPAPSGTSFSPSASFPVVSPDGRLLAFLASRPGEEARLWARRLDSVVANELPGTAGALGPFWSPDSRFLAFFANGALKRVGILGDRPEVVCECVASHDVRSGTWHRNGVILFSRPEGIYRVPAAGGRAERVTSVDARRGETAHVLPQWLPDGRHFLYTTRVGAEGSLQSWIMVRSLEAADDRPLVPAESQAVFVEDGELVYVREGELVAQRFDTAGLKPIGEPQPIVGIDRIGVNPASPRGMFAVSRLTRPRVLAYRAAPLTRLAWFDRRGNALGSIGDMGDRNPALSRDERRIAVTRRDAALRTRTIWILEVDRPGIASQLTTTGWDSCPLWSADDTKILIARGVPDDERVFTVSVDARTAPQPFEPELRGCPLDWSDARTVLYATVRTATSQAEGLWFSSSSSQDRPAALEGTAPPGPRGPRGRISPNGRWLAYEVEDQGRRNIYVRAFPADAAHARKISTRGGIEPQWRADGKELFYIAADRNLMAVPVVTDGIFQSAAPSALFLTDLDPLGVPISGRNQYTVTKDGQRFLLGQRRADAPPPAITVVLNWQTAEKR